MPRLQQGFKKIEEEKNNERLTWVCGKWGLTEVIESHGRPRLVILLCFCFGERKPIEHL